MMALSERLCSLLFYRNDSTLQLVVLTNILLFSSFHYLLALNVTTSEPEACLISNNTYNNGSINIHSSEYHICKWEVSVPISSSVSLSFGEWNDPESYRLYVDMIGELPSCIKPGLVIKMHSHPCEIMFPSKDIIIYINGNTSVTLQEIQTVWKPKCNNSFESTQQISNPNGTCFNVTSYDYVIECYARPYDRRRYDNKYCRFGFPWYCQSVLGHQEALLQCTGDDNVTSAVLIFPKSTIAVSLSYNEITKIEETAFHGFGSKLVYLTLGRNLLVNLESGTFKGMTELVELDLYGNRLKTLPVRIFDDLHNLTQLILYANDLDNLDAALFHNLLNLETLYLFDNKLTYVSPNLFKNLRNLDSLSLLYNDIASVSGCPFQDLIKLTFFELTRNRIEKIDQCTFENLSSLLVLFMGYNQIQELPRSVFHGMPALIGLFINNNILTEIDPIMFEGLHNLKYLSLAENQLSSLSPNMFTDNAKLSFLDLSNNKLHSVISVKPLSQLAYLSLISNPLTILKETMRSFATSAELYVTQHEICECYTTIEDVQCTALGSRSPYLTCDRLLSNTVLRVFMWLIGFSALLGNIFVIVWRNEHDKGNRVQSIILRNLAMSDFLMGVYMIVIASADIYFHDYFPMNAETWRSSILCKVTGALGVVSSEASVFFVTLISIDRYMCMKFPYSVNKLGPRSVMVVILVLWAIAATLSIVPTLYVGKNNNLYEMSHVCIGLPLALIHHSQVDVSTYQGVGDNLFMYYKYKVTIQADNVPSRMYFSTAVFLGVNCLCYLVIMICYIDIIYRVYKSSKSAGRSQEMRQQVRLTLKVAAIVGTDFLCWFPIIILGILVQAGWLLLPSTVIEWLVTFVLPINSAINPYLYTVSDLISKRKQNRAKQNLQRNVPLSTKQSTMSTENQ